MPSGVQPEGHPLSFRDFGQFGNVGALCKSSNLQTVRVPFADRDEVFLMKHLYRRAAAGFARRGRISWTA